MRKIVTSVALFMALLFLISCAGMGGVGSAGPSASPVIDRIAKRGELVVGTAGSMPPLNFTSKDGNVMGIEPELANRIASAMGVKLTLKTMRFHELLPALENGGIDMILSDMTITGKRNLKVAFVGPYFISGKSVLTRIKTVAAIQSAAEINRPEITLAALKNSTSQEFVETYTPKARLVAVDDYDQGVKMVVDGKAQALIADYPICVVSVFRYPDAQLTTLTKPLTFEPIGIAVPAGDPLLVNWLNNFLTAARGSGDLERLQKKWLEDASWLYLLP
jgi:polar amino acid transport system substrate-binding protein